MALPPLERLDDPLPDDLLVRIEVERADGAQLVATPLRSATSLDRCVLVLLALVFFALIGLGVDVDGPVRRRSEVADVQRSVRPAAILRVAELFATAMSGPISSARMEQRQISDEHDAELLRDFEVVEDAFRFDA